MIATPRRTTPVTRTPERTAPESRGPLVSRRLRWGLLAALGFVIVPLVYAVAVLTPVGQRVEDAALGGVRESDLFGSDTALNVISVPVILLLVVVIAAVAFARRRLAVGLGAGVVVLASAATSTLVKRIAERPEIAQSETPNSYPSGHATIALAALFAVLLVTPRRWRPVVTIVGAAYAVFVANQTVVYGWHRVSDIVGACAIALFWLGLVRAVGPRVDRGERGDRDGRRGPRRLVTALLLVATGVGLLVGVAAVVAGLAGIADLHDAVLVAGRMASSVSVLAVVTVVWLADGLHHAAQTDERALPPRR
jgi:membrane-associated phospholipid phosphatase